MIKHQDKNLAVFPCFNLGAGKRFTGTDTNKGEHNGLDWTFTTNPISWVMAIQDGVVKEVGNDKKEIGYYVSIEHTYDDNTKRITGYIHLYEPPIVKVGQTVKAGQQIGYRGGSPYVNGKAMYDPHLHLYVTQPISTNVRYSWNTMRKYADDPLKMKYTKLRSEKDYYVFATEDGCRFGDTAEIYEDCLYKESDIEKQLEEARAENAKLKDQVNRLSYDLAEARNKLDKIKAIIV